MLNKVCWWKETKPKNNSFFGFYLEDRHDLDMQTLTQDYDEWGKPYVPKVVASNNLDKEGDPLQGQWEFRLVGYFVEREPNDYNKSYFIQTVPPHNKLSVYKKQILRNNKTKILSKL